MDSLPSYQLLTNRVFYFSSYLNDTPIVSFFHQFLNLCFSCIVSLAFIVSSLWILSHIVNSVTASLFPSDISYPCFLSLSTSMHWLFGSVTGDFIQVESGQSVYSSKLFFYCNRHETNILMLEWRKHPQEESYLSLDNFFAFKRTVDFCLVVCFCCGVK